MSKTLPTTTRFSSTTSEPIFGGLSALTMAFPEGETFEILPNLCKRNSPLENMYVSVTAPLKLSGWAAKRCNKYTVLQSKDS
jgi:hypothetical protein